MSDLFLSSVQCWQSKLLYTATSLLCFRDMFCAGRVPEEDLKRTMKACGGSIQTSVQNLTSEVLGSCEVFEEIQVGGER